MSCEQFRPGSRQRQICDGEADLPIKKINHYRASWGLGPLEVVPETVRQTVVIHEGAQNVRVRRVDHRSLNRKCATCGPRTSGGPGTELLAIYKSAGVPSCQQCRDLATKMNNWGVIECRKRLDEIIEDIFPRAKQWLAEKRSWTAALYGIAADVASFLSEDKVDEQIQKTIRNDVNKAIDKANAKEVRRNSPASITVRATTARQVEASEPIFRIRTAIRTAFRKEPTLDRTIESMLSGGFEYPIVFADHNTPAAGQEQHWPDVEFVRAAEQLGPFRAFVAMSRRLLTEQPGWLMLCEDDVEFRDGVADFLREKNIAKHQVVSLYMSSVQDVAIEDDGFAAVTGDVWGSLAYLVHSETLAKILQTRAVTEWKLPDRVDRVFSMACKELRVDLLCHRPALAQHIGATSTLVAARRLDERRTSLNFVAERHFTELVTIITPTGDRPEAFARCERWMREQRYSGPVQWIVIDDGAVPTKINDADVVITLSPMEDHSLCRNLREALPHIQGKHIFVIEDDDFYGPDYLSVMVGRLQHADLVGEFGAKYYYLNEQRWRHRHDEQHASLCRTGFNRVVLETLEQCITNTEHPSVDLRLWSAWSGSKFSWVDSAGTSRMCVGLKGSAGRQSYGWSPTRDSEHDRDGEVFRRWTGIGISDLVSY